MVASSMCCVMLLLIEIHSSVNISFLRTCKNVELHYEKKKKKFIVKANCLYNTCDHLKKQSGVLDRLRIERG